MFLQRLAFASMLCLAACAQIAGFEPLGSDKSENAGAGGGSAGSSAASAGKSQTDGGSLGGTNRAGSNHGGALSKGGASSKGGAPSNGGVTSSGGALSNGGSSNNAGALSNAGKGGTLAGGGGAPATGGSTASAGSAGMAPVGVCNSQLLRNGDFDAGLLEWREDSNAPGLSELSDLIVKHPTEGLTLANVAPQSGSYLAWLGGSLDSDKGTHTTLMQDVQIPMKVSRLVLTGWIQIKTTEPDPKYTKDQVDLSLQDDNNFWSFHYWKGNEVTAGWQSFSYEVAEGQVLDVLRGRRLTFYAEAIADTSEISSFWLDSLSLFAECPH
ncbi:MAG TPA: hypothetical protein VJV79_13050 [Polyangiaceae bacterium]|nr:hypothetical protein [Polyangiaceae bacterium]